MENILIHIKEKNWYYNINKSIKKKYKNDAILFSGLLSATFPRFQVKRNFNTSVTIYNDYKNNKNMLKDFKSNEVKALKNYKILKAHYNNIIRVLDNGNKKALELSGNKVNSFYHNIIGFYGEITIDVWMLRLFKHSKKFCNKSEYKRYSNNVKSVRRKIKKVYHINMNNSAVQAILWQYIRKQNGFKPSNFNKYI